MHIKYLFLLLGVWLYGPSASSQWNIIDGISAQWLPLTGINSALQSYNQNHGELLKPFMPLQARISYDVGVGYAFTPWSMQLLYHYSQQSSDAVAPTPSSGENHKKRLTHLRHTLTWTLNSHYQRMGVGGGIQYGLISYKWTDPTLNSPRQTLLNLPNQWWLHAYLSYRLYRSDYVAVYLSPFIDYALTPYAPTSITRILDNERADSIYEHTYGLRLLFSNGPQNERTSP